MPTLDEVLNLAEEAPEMLLNIELKSPRNLEVLSLYDYEKACDIVKTIIERA